MAKKKAKTGLAAQYAAGKKVVVLPFDPADHDLISRAAKKDGRKVAPFIRHYAIEAAKKILEERRK